jgi:membrane-bound metal-dependent hydrolase YbcI (DUF457 family)
MPLPIAHGLLGATIVAAVRTQPSKHFYAPLLFGAFLAIAADSDFLLVFVFDSRSWHRGFSHSLVTGLFVLFLFVWRFGKHRRADAIAFGLAFASHGILDYLTTKEGGGVELFWPFSREGLRLGWWGLSEIPSILSGAEVLRALLVEFLLFVPMLLLVVLLRRLIIKDLDSTAKAT